MVIRTSTGDGSWRRSSTQTREDHPGSLNLGYVTRPMFLVASEKTSLTAEDEEKKVDNKDHQEIVKHCDGVFWAHFLVRREQDATKKADILFDIRRARRSGRTVAAFPGGRP